MTGIPARSPWAGALLLLVVLATPGFVEFSEVTDEIKIDLEGSDNQLILRARDVANSNDFFFDVFDDLENLSLLSMEGTQAPIF